MRASLFFISTSSACHFAGGVDSVDTSTPLRKRELSGKLAALESILTDAIAHGEKTLVFSRSVRLLNVLQAFLQMQVCCGWWW
jgi:hypothetical protein